MTLTPPIPRRTSAVPSVDPSFTTITLSSCATISRRICPTVPALLNVGAITTGRTSKSLMQLIPSSDPQSAFPNLKSEISNSIPSLQYPLPPLPQILFNRRRHRSRKRSPRPPISFIHHPILHLLPLHRISPPPL